MDSDSLCCHSDNILSEALNNNYGLLHCRECRVERLSAEKLRVVEGPGSLGRTILHVARSMVFAQPFISLKKVHGRNEKASCR